MNSESFDRTLIAGKVKIGSLIPVHDVEVDKRKGTRSGECIRGDDARRKLKLLFALNGERRKAFARRKKKERWREEEN